MVRLICFISLPSISICLLKILVWIVIAAIVVVHDAAESIVVVGPVDDVAVAVVAAAVAVAVDDAVEFVAVEIRAQEIVEAVPYWLYHPGHLFELGEEFEFERATLYCYLSEPVKWIIDHHLN